MKDFKEPITKNNRDNLLKALHGHLSEDAAEIAVEDMMGRIKDLHEFILSKAKEDSGVNMIDCINKVVKESNNTLELMIFMYTLGGLAKALSSQSNSVLELLKSLSK